jgi:hypothetical protein
MTRQLKTLVEREMLEIEEPLLLLPAYVFQNFIRYKHSLDCEATWTM